MKWLAVLLLVGCRSKKLDDPMPEPPPAPDAAVAIADAAKPWKELEGYPRVEPVRVIALPAKPDMPKFALGGPVILDDLAVVSSSQFGFVGANWKTGAIAWTKPAGSQVAPPVVVGEELVLMGDCAKPPVVTARESLLGCLRVVDAKGSDKNYVAIRGKRGIDSFLAERGDQEVTKLDDHTVKWKRGDAAIAVDLVTGAARTIDPETPLVVEWKGSGHGPEKTSGEIIRRWDVVQIDGRLVAYKGGTKTIAWQTEQPYSKLVGVVWGPQMGPTLRVATASSRFPEINLIDIDATGSLRASVAKPTPGISVLASAASSIGDTALALRLDSSLRRDLIVGYAGNQLLMWVWPLPEHQRLDRIGVAVSEEADAVVVFHDGDTLTVLPELSAPPTSLGANRVPSKNPTP